MEREGQKKRSHGSKER